MLSALHLPLCAPSSAHSIEALLQSDTCSMTSMEIHKHAAVHNIRIKGRSGILPRLPVLVCSLGLPICSYASNASTCRMSQSSTSTAWRWSPTYPGDIAALYQHLICNVIDRNENSLAHPWPGILSFPSRHQLHRWISLRLRQLPVSAPLLSDFDHMQARQGCWLAYPMSQRTSQSIARQADQRTRLSTTRR